MMEVCNFQEKGGVYCNEEMAEAGGVITYRGSL